ncbi:MAG TPA: 50S ribosomal protein L11 methyltransferase [Acidimicrobiia bacterium]|nr:50S ribosomal protein L11 methyltransferase [Acidimicrobiia bacterium]
MESEAVSWKGRCGPFELRVGPATFRPTTVSVLLADSMQIDEGAVVIDVGCGSGVLSIVAAKLGAAMVYGVDAAPETVEVATANAVAQGVGDRTRFFQGDMFEALPIAGEADVIIGDVSGIPDDIATASGWFPAGLAGGPSGAELPMRMLEEARRFLRRGGKLLLPTGSLQDERSILDKARSLFGSIRRLAERPIPLPSALAEQPAVLRLLRERVIELTERGSRLLWTARVWEMTA